MTNPRQLTGGELDRLVEHAWMLAGMRSLLPIELYIKLDTFLVDLRVEQDDRTARRV